MPDRHELAAFKAAIQDKYNLHCAAFNAEDAQTIITRFFTPDALWLGQGYPQRHGHQELYEMFQEVVKTGRVGYTSKRSFVNGDSGWDYCDWHVSPLDKSQPGWVFKTMFCWVRVNGEWFCNAVTCFPVPLS